ncbi:Pantoate kinase, archaeal [Methanosarcina horonobensis HB-1 = JCM 15518]|uniref:Pantoate kinase n=1 Tax=Methanosarcina horonobensis HB-1 = JCM 15518 TaxID=1434110 RepID=A0A0E3SDJ3_9EURY|nr:pantoate kinase [Methanosarcina horonobensis]AKB77533.1 Pantoate kinase, archaeal [Methanosarcina horonobensis HB-1 = JCM 15518]
MYTYESEGADFLAKAYAPGHITGFFQIHEHNDPRRKGSTGCGIVLNGGVTTEVKVGKSVERTEIFLNGKKVEGKTTRTVVEMMADVPVRVKSWAEIPVGCGFGASGAGALGTAYALNRALSLNKTVKDLTEYAHVAEVINRSGLGDIAAQSNGGVVIRLQPGGPEFGNIDRIPAPEARVFCIVLGEISTDSILADEATAGRINAAGKTAMSELLKKPTLETFMHQAKDFASRTGLMSNMAQDVIEAAHASGGLASQAMLGDTVFAIAPYSQEFPLYEALQEFGQVLEYGISTCVPRLLYD